MAKQNKKTLTVNAQDEKIEVQRSLENILDEYKIIAVKLYEFSDSVIENEDEANAIAKEQARLLDVQQTLISEAGTMNVQSARDASILLELWHADELLGEHVTPSQGLVLSVNEYLLDNIS